MLNRGLLIGGAVAIAAVVLLVTLLAGPSIAPPPPNHASAPGEADLPLGSGAPTRSLEDSLPVLGASRGEYAFQHGDRWTYLQFDEVTPLPDGVIDVVEPRARTHFARDRVLEMTADAGRFVAPDNQPRRGDFRGDVVLTLYESPDGSAVDFDDPRHIQMIVYLDAASFDLELGQVDSNGPVHLTGPSVDFRGTGLSLNYNPRRERLEHLEIFKGQSLRFRGHEKLEPQREVAVDAEDADDAAGADAAAAPETDADAETDTVLPDPQPQPEPAQYYLARFNDAVRVESPGDPDRPDDDATLTGDALTVLFSLGQPASVDAPDDTSADLAADVAAQPAAGDPVDVPAITADAAAPTAIDVDASGGRRLLMAPRQDDVVITWTGRLVVEPQADKPAELAGPDDLLLGMLGEPVHIRTGRDETIVAGEVDYLVSSGRVRAHAQPGDERSVMLTSPRLGILTGSELAIDQAAGTGHVLGPGWLKRAAPQSRPTADDATADEPPQPASDDAGAADADETPQPPATEPAQPDDIEVAWRDRLDLTFHTADAGEGTTPRIAGLRTAVFRGDAVANHPRFDLRGDELAVRLSEPVDDRPQTLDRIDATGHVELAARSSQRNERIDVRSDELSIALATDDAGQRRPTRFIAHGHVEAVKPELRLSAGHLDITPAPPTPDDDAASSDERADSELTISRMLATDDVHLHLVERDLTLVGRRLTVDGPTDRIDLFGDDDEPARVLRPDGVLTGRHIVVGKTAQTVNVVGAGTIDLAALPDDPDSALHVTWRSAMHFDNLAGDAEFVDGVVATTRSPTDRSRLTADHLHLDLAAHSDADPPPDEGPEADQPASTSRLRTATARGNAVFTAYSFEVDEAPDETRTDDFLTHVRLEGPVMTFDRRDQANELQVLGAGRILLIDRRPTSPSDAVGDDSSAGAAGPIDDISGRGATLFLWSDNLTLDAADSDMLLTGDVKMTHRPPPTATGAAAEPIHFDAQRLVVDFHETDAAPQEATDDGDAGDTGGAVDDAAVEVARSPAGLWTDQDLAGLTIRQIEAHDRVLITRAPHHVIADHLRYDAARGAITLEADSGHIVEIIEDGQPTPITGRTIIWNLETDAFDVREAGGATIPLRR